MTTFDHFSMNDAISAVCKHANEMGISVTISIVNSAGLQSGMLRMPNSFLASIDYAFWKAWTAASFSMSTTGFSEMLRTLPEEIRAGLLEHPNATALPGGVPVIFRDELLGAVGISGGSGEQDNSLARLAADTLLDAAAQNAPG